MLSFQQANGYVVACTALVYNILRFIGQLSLVTSRRIKTVIQERFDYERTGEIEQNWRPFFTAPASRGGNIRKNNT